MATEVAKRGIEQHRTALNAKQQVIGELKPQLKDVFDSLHMHTLHLQQWNNADRTPIFCLAGTPHEQRFKDLENKTADHEVLLTETYRATQQTGTDTDPNRVKTIEDA